MDSCRMWVTPIDFPLSLSGLLLTLLVSCGERIGPLFLDLCMLAVFWSYNTSIFLGVPYIKSKSLYVVVCHTQHVNFLELLCSFDPTIHNSSRADSPTMTVSSLIGAPQVGGNVSNRGWWQPRRPWVQHWLDLHCRWEESEQHQRYCRYSMYLPSGIL